MVSVAQLVVAPGCGLGGRGFKSHRSPQKYKGIAVNLWSLFFCHFFIPHTIPHIKNTQKDNKKAPPGDSNRFPLRCMLVILTFRFLYTKYKKPGREL
jgi:hypothetical protein